MSPRAQLLCYRAALVVVAIDLLCALAAGVHFAVEGRDGGRRAPCADACAQRAERAKLEAHFRHSGCGGHRPLSARLAVRIR